MNGTLLSARSSALAAAALALVLSACGGSATPAARATAGTTAPAATAAAAARASAAATSAPAAASTAVASTQPATASPAASATAKPASATTPVVAAAPAAATAAPVPSAPASTPATTAAPAATIAPAPTAPPAQQANATSVLVTLADTSIKLDRTSAPSGPITFAVKNAGSVAHELVLLKTDVPQDQIPVDPSKPGLVSQPGYVTQTSSLAPGATTNLVLNLSAGGYVLLCNQPAHYLIGMHTAFAAN